MSGKPRSKRRTSELNQRRGAIVVLAAVFMVAVLGMVAFAIDIGYVSIVRSEAQSAADSAALAAAWDLFGEERLRGDLSTVYTRVRNTAVDYAKRNEVGPFTPKLQANHYNSNSQGDILIGRLDNPSNQSEQLSFGNSSEFNTVTVHVRLTADRNQQLPLFFGRTFGLKGVDIEATASATVEDGVAGFRMPGDGSASSLLPFAVSRDDWKAMLNGAGQDEWTADGQHGGDGIPEMKMFPESKKGKGSGSTGAGNFGTLDIGHAGNSTADVRRQILNGPNADDFAHHDGELVLDENGSLELNGDTGVSAGMSDALMQIIGQARTIPIYDTFKGNGNNLYYRIVGFVGIKIVDVDLHGGNKYIMIQPSYVFDRGAVVGGQGSESDFVLRPVRLVR